MINTYLTSSNYPCVELIFMVPKVFEPLKLDCCVTADQTPLTATQGISGLTKVKQTSSEYEIHFD